MAEETEEEVVPSTDETSESSTEDQVEEATSEKAPEKEPPFHEHPRWKEVQEAKSEAERQAAEARAQAEYYKGLLDGSKPKELPDVEGNTPEEREFWNKVREKARREVDATLKEKEQQFQRELEAVRNEYGRLAASQFLKEHPDVKKDSPELKEIVKKSAQTGLPLDESYRIVMFDRAREMAVEEDRRKKQEQYKKKLAANVETKGTSKLAPVAQNEQDFDTAFNAAIDESGVEF